MDIPVFVIIAHIIANFRPDVLAVRCSASSVWVWCVFLEKEVFVYHVANFGIIVVEFRMSQVFVPVLAFDDVKGLSRWSHGGGIVALVGIAAVGRYAIVAVFAGSPKEGEHGKEKVFEELVGHNVQWLGSRVWWGEAVVNFPLEEIFDFVDLLLVVRVYGGVTVTDLLFGENID